MNLRTYIVKMLYPLCSDEVQILLDQMREHPEKFEGMFARLPSYTTDNPWLNALSGGGFELIDYVALRQQLKLVKNKYAKQLILEGLLEANERAENRESNLDMFDSLLRLQKAQAQKNAKNAFKAQVDAQFKKEYADYKRRNKI